MEDVIPPGHYRPLSAGNDCSARRACYQALSCLS